MSVLRLVLEFWIADYNPGRPHMSLGLGIPALVYPSPLRTSIVIEYLRIALSGARLFSPDSITTIGVKTLRHELRIPLLRTTGVVGDLKGVCLEDVCPFDNYWGSSILV